MTNVFQSRALQRILAANLIFQDLKGLGENSEWYIEHLNQIIFVKHLSVCGDANINALPCISSDCCPGLICGTHSQARAGASTPLVSDRYHHTLHGVPNVPHAAQAHNVPACTHLGSYSFKLAF